MTHPNRRMDDDTTSSHQIKFSAFLSVLSFVVCFLSTTTAMQGVDGFILPSRSVRPRRQDLGTNFGNHDLFTTPSIGILRRQIERKRIVRSGALKAARHSSPSSSSSRRSSTDPDESDIENKMQSSNELVDRRRSLAIFASAIIAGHGSTVHIETSSAAETTTSPVTAKDVLSRLVSIPTFCLVDPNGVPFMIFDSQSTATGYFFLSFEVAAEALEDARKKDTKTSVAQELWKSAQIIVVPLSVAIQLALTKRQRTGVNSNISSFNTFNDIVASAEGVSDARLVSKAGNPDRWSQKGRVPLFYIDGLTIPDPKGGPTRKQPRYFNKTDLLAEWRTQNGSSTPPPPVQLVEMIELFRNALSKNDWSSVDELAIMPVKETNQVAKELQQRTSSNNIKYSFEKVFLVNNAK
eukprot:CAMPEP_0113465856 /NCGR_PEP_ID=MMETSP0014_2-20120614/13964_1 /TAXON_ID=2857 /ORGANISM="Nitzschia sp." /LENGTH=407 /DNA_ID=CAMNT_0000358045 /DNA_START=173 /DNA_END=1396 /DNA_ORIENTATION=+ /assembly_acc=CAM_ASM_000159